MAAMVPSSTTEETIEKWMDDYGTILFRVCYIMLKDYALAEDAVQETFVKAYKSFEKFESSNPLGAKSWLTRIAINTCKDLHKSAWFRFTDRRVAVEDVPQRIEAPNSEKSDLMDAIMKLPLKFREVVLLYYYEDIKYEDISKIIGISNSTVHGRLKKATRKLRELLERG